MLFYSRRVKNRPVFILSDGWPFRCLDYSAHFPFLQPPKTLCDIHIHFNTHTKRKIQGKKKQNKATQTSEISVLWRSYSNVPLSPVLWRRPPKFEVGKWKWKTTESLSHILATHTLRDPEYWSTEQQLGICYKWWNCNVLRHTEIGFFSDTLTSCSWEDRNLILTCYTLRLWKQTCS